MSTAPRVSRRRALFVALTIAAALAAAGLAVATLLAWRKATRGLTIQFGSSRVTAIAVAPADDLVASAHDDGVVRLWSLDDGRLVGEIARSGNPGYSAEALAFSPSGDRIAVGYRDGGAFLFPADSSSASAEERLAPDGEGVLVLALSPRGDRVARSGTRGVRLGPLRAGPELIAALGQAYGLAFSPSGALLATASADGAVRLLSSETGAQVRALTPHEGPAFAVAFSRSGELLASGGRDGIVRLSRVADGTLLRELKGHEDDVYSVAFSPGDDQVATAGRSATRVWSTSSGALVRRHDFRAYRLAFLSSGALVLGGGLGEEGASAIEVTPPRWGFR